MASSSTPCSSITTPTKKKYEVFLSFRGEDTRNGFTSHLYDALCGKQIETFIDDDKLERGDEISSALLRAIEESKIAAVIFSENYASSKWCLRELAEIIKCKKMNKLIVMPVFYHVDPSDVRKQTGSFGCSLANYEEKELPEEVQKWREALTEASNLSGWDSSVIRTESKLVGDIVEGVWRKLMNEYISASSDFEGLIGIDKRIEYVMSLLCLEIEDVRIIGIWGMGDIGKTTIARAVFKFISNKFDGACFIEKVGKRLLENDRSDRLLCEVLSEVLHEENLKLGTPTICPFIMQMFKQKKVFIVLDDVNNFLQSESLVKPLCQCGLGSRIIIISRDKQVLRDFDYVDYHEIYEEKGLDDDEALKLFHQFANPTKDCRVLTKEIVNYAKGNPLALKVLGLSLKGESKQVWESALNNLKGIVYPKVFDVLKISYDGLNEKEQSLFLDIACFEDLYNPLKNEALDCEYSLSVLIAKSLVTVKDMPSHNYIEMHGLLQEMGREIVRKESLKTLGMRCRLWERDYAIRILKNNTGTDVVRGISLDMDDIEDIHLSSQVFDKMDNLRILFFQAIAESNKVHLPDGLNCFPNELRILHWHGYPLRALPSHFDPKKLAKLDLSKSNIEQLWEGTKEAPNLKLLILSDCQHLSRIPDLSDSPLLVEVNLTNCKSLVGLTSSFHQLNNLRDLDLYGCNVTRFPLISGSIERLNLSGTAIEEVPSSIQSLTNLTKLHLSNCTRLKHISASICKLKSLSTLDLRDCSQLETFPEILETMESLKSLELCGSAIKVLPPSIEHLNGLRFILLYNCTNLEMLPSSICNLTSLQYLHLSNCKNLEMLPGSICNLTSLETLFLYECSKLDKLPDNLGSLKSLKYLDVSGSGIVQLPSSITFLENLQSLKCYGCRGLTILPPLSGLHTLTTLDLRDCCQLETFPEILETMEFLKSLDLSGSAIKVLHTSIEHLNGLQHLTLVDCKNLEMLPSSICNLTSLVDLHLCNCSKLDKLPDNLGNLKSLKRLEVSGTAVGQLPSSITCLENLEFLDCSGCRGLTKLPPLSGLHSLRTRHSDNCSLMEIPEDIGCLSSLKQLYLRGNMFESLPKSIKQLSKLEFLSLNRCKMLRSLPELPEGLKILKAMDCDQLCQLPDVKCLENLEALDCSRCSLMEIPEDIGRLSSLKKLKLSRNMFESLPKSIKQLSKLEFLSLSHCKKLQSIPELPAGLKFLRGMNYNQLCQLLDAKCLENLEALDCSGCSLTKIPEDIGCLSSLKKLELSENMFESLPKSIKQLSKLEFLSLSHCKMIRSIPELPEGLKCLEAMDCGQLCQVPDASEFVRCVNSKPCHSVKFRFTNCLNLIKAVNNVFEESLRKMQHIEKGSGKSSNAFSIYLPGNEIPKWFSYQSPEPSINIRVLRNDLVNRKFMGFAMCAVLGFEEYYRGFGCKPVDVYCDFEIYHGHIKIGKGSKYDLTNRPSDFSVFRHLEHMLLGYCSFSSFYSSFQNLNELPISDSDCLDVSIEFKYKYGGNRPKRCAVHLIYAEDTMKEIGETSGRRSDRSDDNDEEVEPHSKRICTQAIQTLNVFLQAHFAFNNWLIVLLLLAFCSFINILVILRFFASK